MKIRLLAFAGILIGVTLTAQELSVEDSYLQTSQNIMVIEEYSNSLDREHKLAAVLSIEELVKKGDKPEEARKILGKLGLEGTLNKESFQGRVLNNYPDVRERSARLLAEFPGPQTVSSLEQIVVNEKEPAVISAAIDSLTKLSAFDTRTLNTVQFVLYQYNALANDSRLANSLLNYYDKCPPNGTVMAALSTIRDNPRYTANVKHRAEQIFKRKGLR
ncbi:MAG: hypothetical protein LBG72_07895 [Spirochaetaceae bacterium]|jgi:hypothetical protein|nr:hypothetical protein [Spirochaetaceae bacterium]